MSTEQILSSDGLPLEVSLRKAERKNKLKALFLVTISIWRERKMETLFNKILIYLFIVDML